MDHNEQNNRMQRVAASVALSQGEIPVTKFTDFCRGHGFEPSEMTAEQLENFSDFHAQLCAANPDGSEPEPQEEAETKNLKPGEMSAAAFFDPLREKFAEMGI
jgi:hypothetical protein